MDVKQRIADIIYQHGWNEWREQCTCGEDGPGTYEHHFADMLVNELTRDGLIIIPENEIPQGDDVALTHLDAFISGFMTKLDKSFGTGPDDG